MKALLLSFFILMINIAHADEAHVFASPQEANRFYTLTKEIRCVVCQNENIADSTAPLANDLREKIYRMVNDQKSNAEIKDYLVKRYGEFILLQPRLSQLTVFLWLFPLLGIASALYLLKKWVNPTNNGII